MGSARVEFISTRAVASPENEQDVLCLSIKSNDAFRFKTEINFQRQQQHLVDNTITILNIHLSERVIIMWLINQHTICFISPVQDIIILGVPGSAEVAGVVYRVNVREVTNWSDVLVVACTADAELGLQCSSVWR